METKSENQREHYWDALRAFLMLLGIPYHVVLSYQPGQDFIVHSGEGVAGFPEIGDALHLFRMPAFFVIAGYFAMLLLARRAPLEWLKGRFLRLGIPFLTSILTLVPAMNLVCELSNMPWHEALRSWRENSLTSGGYWVRHLWFIIVLLYCSTLAALLASRFPAIRTGLVPPTLDRRAARHLVLTVLGIGVVLGGWQALALEGFYQAGLATMLPQQVLRLDETIIYAPWFLLGCVLVRSPRLLERITRLSWPILFVAIFGTSLWLLVHKDVVPMTERFIGTFAALAATQVLIAAARALLDRPIPLVRRLTDASFVIYLFHLPLITLLVWLAQWLAVPPLLKALAIMALSFTLSYAAWRGIGRIRSMSLLFEGIAVPRRSTASAAH